MGLSLMLWANCLPSKIILPLKVSSISCLKGLKTRNFHLRWSCGNIAKEIYLPHSKDASLRDHGLQPLPLKINMVLLANNIPLLRSNSKLLYKFSHSANFGVLTVHRELGRKTVHFAYRRYITHVWVWYHSNSIVSFLLTKFGQTMVKMLHQSVYS